MTLSERDEMRKIRIAELEAALRAIQQATIEGRVCDDVAWFSNIETLHDYCASVLDRAAPFFPSTAKE